MDGAGLVGEARNSVQLWSCGIGDGSQPSGHVVEAVIEFLSG